MADSPPAKCPKLSRKVRFLQSIRYDMYSFLPYEELDRFRNVCHQWKMEVDSNAHKLARSQCFSLKISDDIVSEIFSKFIKTYL